MNGVNIKLQRTTKQYMEGSHPEYITENSILIFPNMMVSLGLAVHKVGVGDCRLGTATEAAWESSSCKSRM